MITTLLEGIHSEMLYGHEGQFKIKERVLQSYWCKGLDQDINELLKNQKTKKLTHPSNLMLQAQPKR
jgi:hypothetical protein